jgi:multidrug efflux pump subunit AcrA (membrane-fusion protein)
MSEKFWRVILPGVILLAGVGIALGLMLIRPGETNVPKVEPIPVVDVVQVRPHVGTVNIEADGVVVPYREFQVAAQVEGKVVFKADLCRAGFFVPPKSLLFRIDPTDYQLQEQRLEQEVRQASNALEELKVEIANIQDLLRVAQQDYELEKRSFARQEELHRNRIISDADYEQASRSLLKAENALVTLQNQLRTAQARKESLEAVLERVRTQLAEVKVRLARTEIYSPADVETVVIRDSVEVGDYVRAGTILAVLEDVSRAEVRVNLRRDQFSWIWAIKAGQSSQDPPKDPAAAYRLPALPVTVTHELEGAKFAWEGFLWRYEGLGLNEATRTVPCRILVENRGKSKPQIMPDSWRVPAGPPILMRGMFVSVQIHVPQVVPMLRIPEETLQPGNWVWRFEPTEHPQDLKPSQSEIDQREPQGTTQSVGTSPAGAGSSAASHLAATSSGQPVLISQGASKGSIGRVCRVQVQPVANVRIPRLVYAEGGIERVIDGKTLRFENGQLVQGSAEGGSPQLLWSSPIFLQTAEGLVPIDGVRYQVLEGVVHEMSPTGPVPLPDVIIQLPPEAPLGVQLLRELIVPARPGYLEAGDFIVITPLVANDGTLVQTRGEP